MKFGKGQELKKTKVEIIPMIDTMFFLLVFFILSSVGVIKLQGINIDLPKSAPSTQLDPKKNIELTVAINENQQIRVNAIPVRPRGDIGPILKSEYFRQAGGSASLDDASVVISAKPSVPHGTVVRCIDQARAVKINKFAIATEPDAAGGAVPDGGTSPGSGTTTP